MVGRIALDVAPGNPTSVSLALVGMVVLMVLVEAGILALWGMRPVSKAFTSSFMVNLAAIGAGVVLYMIGIQLELQSPWRDIFVVVAVIVAQGFILAANRAPLSLPRVWMAAVSMKVVSVLLLFGLAQLVIR